MTAPWIVPYTAQSCRKYLNVLFLFGALYSASHIQWLTSWENDNHATAATSLLGEQSSDRSSFVEEHQDDFVPPEDDPVLQQTTVVVKAVMELSNKVPLSQPTDYVEFVKVRDGQREGGREEGGGGGEKSNT